jgi:hypothetical protein
MKGQNDGKDGVVLANGKGVGLLASGDCATAAAVNSRVDGCRAMRQRERLEVMGQGSYVR